MKRRMPLLLAAVTALALVAAGCGDPDTLEPSAPSDPPADEPADDEADDPAEEPADDPADEPVDEPDTDAAEEPDAEVDGPEVVVFVTRARDHTTFVEPVTTTVPTDLAVDLPDTDELTGDDLDLATMATLFAFEPDDPDVGTAVPTDVAVLGVARDGGTLVVDVEAALTATSGGSAQELALVQQLAHTAAALDGIDAVQLTVDGAAIDELWGHLGWADPLEPDPVALSPITLADPAFDAAVPAGEVPLSGEATVFEATFLIEVIGPDGEVILDSFVTASTGGPDRGDWSETLTLDAPGTYTVTVSEEDVSDGEGFPPYETTRVFEVIAG